VKERWDLPNSVVWICHSSIMGKEKTNDLCKKTNDLGDSFNEITF